MKGRALTWLFDSRFLLTLLVISVIHALQCTGVGVVLTPAKTELFDQLVKSRRNTVGGEAPPVVNLAFDRESRAEYWTKAMPGASFSRWPTVTPLAIVSRVLDLVKAGCERAEPERACPRVVIVDIDVDAIGAQRTEQEVAGFTQTLKAWAGNPRLPLVAFARAPEWRDSGALDGAKSRFVLAPAPSWDAIVQAAPNLTWAAGEALAGEDGVVRQYAYYTCVYPPGSDKAMALPHAALYALAAWASKPNDAKAAVERSVSGQCRTPDSDTPAPFTIAIAPDATYHVQDRVALIGYHLADPAEFGASPVLTAESGAPGSRAVQVIPVRVLFAPNARADVADNAILVLSSSQPTFEDIHWSPYGRMAGGLILANCARSLILDGPMQGLGPWLSGWLLLVSCVGMHAFTLLMHHHHQHLRLRAGQSPTRIGNALRAATSAEGAKFVALVGVFLIGRFTGLWLAPYAMWESIAIMGFVVVLYSLFNELYEAWRARNDTV